MKTLWYKSAAFRVFSHVVGWAIALSLPYLLDTHRGMHHESVARQSDFLKLNLITNILLAAPFYLNAYLLIPQLLYRRRYLLLTGALLLSFAVLFFINSILFNFVFRLGHYSPFGAFGFMLPAFALVIAVSTTFRMVGDNIRAERRSQEQQKENMKTELSFLRSQINPHFIFNILNNLVALERQQSPELGPTILKLSSLMQYMLYETDEDRVPLAMEVEYLQSYIDLQRQRFGRKMTITVQLPDLESFFDIEPMLLIPFVENAFKHGVGMIDQQAIDIEMKVQDAVLQFSVRNRYNPLSEEVKDKTSGIGLGNVKRRLELLYGNNHSLKITQDAGWFSVLLSINLH